MSYREIAKDLIDKIPDNKMFYIVTFLQGAAVPNADTVDAIQELENGGGTLFKGNTDELFKTLMET